MKTAVFVTTVAAAALCGAAAAFAVAMLLMPFPFNRADPRPAFVRARWAALLTFLSFIVAGVLAADPVATAFAVGH